MLRLGPGAPTETFERGGQMVTADNLGEAQQKPPLIFENSSYM